MTVQGDLSTTTKIARIIELLSDNQWHTLGEVQKKTNLSMDQLQQVTAFLKEYQFIASDTRGDIKLREAARRFLTQTVTS
jgi:hypothetical protein